MGHTGSWTQARPQPGDPGVWLLMAPLRRKGSELKNKDPRVVPNPHKNTLFLRARWVGVSPQDSEALPPTRPLPQEFKAKKPASGGKRGGGRTEVADGLSTMAWAACGWALLLSS